MGMSAKAVYRQAQPVKPARAATDLSAIDGIIASAASIVRALFAGRGLKHMLAGLWPYRVPKSLRRTKYLRSSCRYVPSS